MCCIELFFNKCLWMKNCHITRERSPKKWKTCITFAIRCRNLSQITLFALKRDICLSPNDEHGSLTLDKEQPQVPPGARPTRHVGLEMCRKETTLGDMWSDEEPKVVGERARLRGSEGRGRGPLATVASWKGPHSQVMFHRWLVYLMNWSKLPVLKHKQHGSSTGCFF